MCGVFFLVQHVLYEDNKKKTVFDYTVPPNIHFLESKYFGRPTPLRLGKNDLDLEPDGY